MSWMDRLQPNLVLISPSGLEFSASWRGDPREMDKKLGVFEYPGIPGARVQDLDVRAPRYPLTLFFEGENHDITANVFFTACKERGPWFVEHPTLGRFKWNLISVREEIQPVESGNITGFQTEWIEPIDGFLGVSVTQRAASVRNRIDQVQSVANGQFANVVKIDQADLLTSFRKSVTELTTRVTNTLKPLTDTVAEINAAIESVHRGIVTTIVDPALSVLALGGQIQSLVTLPAMAEESIGARLDYYGDLISSLFDGDPDSINVSATREIVGTSSVVAAATVLMTEVPATREDALLYLDDINQMLADVTAGLDASQAFFAEQTIDDQYFSQSESYNDLVLLVAEVNRLLLTRIFDLSVARRFTLQRNRAPVEIAITEQIDLDLFITSNLLEGNDILLLPAGREVVVYQ